MTEYNMRGLKTADIFRMSKILKKMSFKIEADDKTTQTQAGIQFIQKIAENIHVAEAEVNEFLGELVGLSGKQFGELEIDDTLAIISQFKQQKGLNGFFKLASK